MTQNKVIENSILKFIPIVKSMTISSLLISIILFDIIAIIVAIAIGVHGENPLKHFGEHQFITWISAFQLLTISWLSYNILQTRRLARGHCHWQDSFMVWAIISFGFFFLAIDDLFQIHERIDHGIHYIFNVKETGVTDRIDDILIALYGLVGMSILYTYREEMRKYRKVFPFLIYGFVLLFTMVALDVLTNRNDILVKFVHRDLSVIIHGCFSIAEDSLKVFAESFFLVGFYAALQIARRMDTKPVVHADIHDK